MRSEQFTIPYPADTNGGRSMGKYSLNAIYSGRGNWRAQQTKRTEDKRLWRALTLAALNRAKIRGMFEKPVEIVYYWDDGLDIDNHAYVSKLITDSLKQRLIHDDTRRYVKAVHHVFHDGHCIRVRVSESEEEP